MRGFGRSTTNEACFPSNEEQAEDLKVLLNYLGIERVTLVGLSHGGAVAQHFALRFPEYLQGLVIVSSFARASGSTAIFLNLLHGFLARGDLSTFWEVLRAFLYSEKNFAHMMQKERALKRLMFNQYTCESLEHIYACSLKHNTTALLPKIKTPTLVIGGKEDMLFPPKITAEITSLIPGAQERLLEAAHIPPIEDPETFRATLEEFLVSI
jgi:3-oxoadipate enol-lactonase